MAPIDTLSAFFRRRDRGHRRGHYQAMIASLAGLTLLLAPPVLPAAPNGAVLQAPAAVEAPPNDAAAETSLPDPPQAELAEPSAAPMLVDPPATEPAPELLGPLEDELAPIVADSSGRASWKKDFVRVQRPAHSGTGMFVASGISFGAALLAQSIDSMIFGNIGVGIVERSFLGVSIGLAAGGGVKRGRAAAYDDTALARKRPDIRKGIIAGGVLVGVGAALGLANESMWWRCVVANVGPYQTDDVGDFNNSGCRTGLNRAVLDVSAATTAAGLGVLTWALVYRRHARAYERAHIVGLRPSFTREYASLTIEGRF